MAKSDSLWRSIQKHPVFSGGDPDEAFLLDWMEAMLSVCGEETDFTVKSLASHLERHPERWPTFIEKSQKDPLAWEALQVLIARLDEKPPKIPVEDEAKWEAGRDALNRWARDAVKVGKEAHTKSVSRGRRAGKQEWRNSLIITTMEGIRACSGKPLFDDYDETRSVAYAVAQRLGMHYPTVRAIWMKNHHILHPLRKMGLAVPFMKGLRARAVYADSAEKTKTFNL